MRSEGSFNETHYEPTAKTCSDGPSCFSVFVLPRSGKKKKKLEKKRLPSLSKFLLVLQSLLIEALSIDQAGSIVVFHSVRPKTLSDTFVRTTDVY